MKKIQPIKLFACLITLVFLLAALLDNTKPAPRKNYFDGVYQTLLQREQLGNKYADVVRRTFSLALEASTTKVSVNDDYLADAINIYILKSNQANQIGFTDDVYNIFIQKCKGNFISIHPNVICIDEDFLDQLIKTAALQAMSNEQQSIRMTKLSENRAFSQVGSLMLDEEKLNAISFYAQLNNQGVDNAELRDEVLDINKEIQFIEKMLTLISLHEIYHIKEFGGEVLANENGLPLSGSEQAADQFSSEKIREKLSIKIKNLEDYAYTSDTEIQVIAFLRYLKYQYYHDAFNHLYGLESDDHLATMIYADDMVDSDKNGRQESNQERILAAFFNPIPIISKKEYEQLQAKYKGESLNQRHSHITDRIRLVADTLVKVAHRRKEFKALLLLQKSFTQEVLPDQQFEMFGLDRFNDSGSARLPLTSKAVMAALGSDYVFSQSAFYDTIKCMIGKATYKDKNSIVICGEQSIYYMRLIADWGGRGEDEHNVDEYSRIMALLNLSADKENALFDSYRAVVEGSKYNVTNRFKGSFLNIRRVNQSHKIAISFVPWRWEPGVVKGNDLRNMMLY